MTTIKNKPKLVTFAIAIVLLTGCGGGSGGGSNARHTVGTANATEATRTLTAGEPTQDGDNTWDADETWTSEPGPQPETALTATILSWTAPVSRVDGTPFSLSELRGYVLSLGDESKQYDQTIELDALTDEYPLQHLQRGHYYVAIQALDRDGRLSPYSDELLIAVN